MVSAFFSPSLAAADAAASAQHYPHGALYVVATPIGNLADITLRALHVLQLCNAIACEDTRHTRQLLRAYGIDKHPEQLLALHQHNESQAARRVLALLQAGQRVAYVSDAGTPGISDPGARLVAAVTQQGLRCIPLPGASSVTTLVSVAGCSAGAGSAEAGTTWAGSAGAGSAEAGNTGVGNASGFVFHGFLPGKGSQRSSALAALAQEPRAVLLLEAPHRIAVLAQSLLVFGTRPLTIGRELTKQFEEIATLPANAFSAWLQADTSRLRGEFALLLHPVAVPEGASTAPRILRLLLTELPLKTAVRLCAEITGEARNALYEQALALKNGDS